MEASNISVVITHYNDLEGLSECIAAWGKQTVKPLEVIVVDDGSRSQLGLEVWKASFRYAFRLVCHPKNLGVPAAMNTGLREVTGAYVHFASCSDLPDRDFIKTLLPRIWPAPGSDATLPAAVFARARWVDRRAKVWALRSVITWHLYSQGAPTSKDLRQKRASRGCPTSWTGRYVPGATSWSAGGPRRRFGPERSISGR
jgi:glycosyltransferase involved in cell wall biosynthesis